MTAEGILTGVAGVLIALGAIWVGTEWFLRLQDRLLSRPPLNAAFAGWLARYRRYPFLLLAGGVVCFVLALAVTPSGS